MNKNCPNCNTIKPSTDFNRNKARKDGLQHQCRICQSKTDRKHYKNSQNRREKIRLTQQNKRRENRKYVYNYLLSNPCVICNESDPIVLTFDHLRDKKFVISEAVSKAFSTTRLKKEIEKCQILCANCHLRKTASDYEWYKELI
jgi:hypothetical protein